MALTRPRTSAAEYQRPSGRTAVQRSYMSHEKGSPNSVMATQQLEAPSSNLPRYSQSMLPARAAARAQSRAASARAVAAARMEADVPYEERGNATRTVRRHSSPPSSTYCAPPSRTAFAQSLPPRKANLADIRWGADSAGTDQSSIGPWSIGNQGAQPPHLDDPTSWFEHNWSHGKFSPACTYSTEGRPMNMAVELSEPSSEERRRSSLALLKISSEGERIFDEDTTDLPTLPEADNLKVRLTMRPSVLEVDSLKRTTAEAKRVLDKTSVNGAKLIAAAEAKLDACIAEMDRCVEANATRRAAFHQCAVIQRAVEDLVSAAGVATEAVGETERTLTRAQFLDVHVNFVRAGCLARDRVGDEASQGIYIYAPPLFVRRFGGTGTKRRTRSSRESKDRRSRASRESKTGEEEEERLGRTDGLAAWDAGIALWKMISRRKSMGDGRLSANALAEAVFELVDARLTHKYRGEIRPGMSGDRVISLQEYLDEVAKLVRGCVETPPSADDTAPLSVSLSQASPRPSTAQSRLQGAAKMVIANASRPRLRYAWPAYGAHCCEVFGKVQILRAALRERHEGECSLRTAIKEFRTYTANLGVNARALGYAQLATVMRHMPGESYLALTFRHAVVGRDVGHLKADRSEESTGGAPGDPTLLEALNTDADIMLSLMRWLDRDCDGMVSENDFSSAMMDLPYNIDDAVDEARKMEGRWAFAARGGLGRALA